MDTVLIDAWPGDVRVAVMRDGRVTDFEIDRASRPSVAGSVFLGRVTAVTAAIDAAFVDIGLDRPGFLGLADARPVAAAPKGKKDRIGDYVTEGQVVLVQVLADPTQDAGGAKGAKLTARVTLPGRYLVLTPGDAKLRLSKKLDDAAALTALLADARPDADTGFVVRTRAAQASPHAVKVEAEKLVEAWGVIKSAQDGTPPQRVYEDDAVARALRLAPDDAKIVMTGPMAADLRQRLGRGEVWNGAGDLFAAFDGDEDWQGALATAVPLTGGGGLTIERTAALTAIDVNVGARSDGNTEATALAVNRAAAREIARQIRLRHLGGLFVIDFVRLKKPANRARMLADLRAAVADDAERVQVAGETTFGLIEMTRPRRRPALADSLADLAETAAYDVVRAVLAESRAQPGVAVSLTCAPDVAEALCGPCAPAWAALADRLGRPVDMKADPAMLPGTVLIGQGR